MSLPAAAESDSQSLEQEIDDQLSSWPPVQNDGYGQLLLVTNECTGDRALRDIQSEVDRIFETLGDRSVITLRKATLSLLASAVKKYSTAVVAAHFSGHGSEGFAVHAGSSNRLIVPPPNELAQTFTACARLQCVVFNACRTAAAADAFLDYCPTVSYIVYFEKRISDEAAHVFAHGFYVELKEDWDVEAAFGAARRLLQSYPEHFFEGQLPRIEIRKGTEPPAFEVGAPRRSLRFKVVVMRSLSQAEDYVDDICDSIRRELLELIGLDVKPEHIIVEKRKTRWEIRLDNARELETTEAQAKEVFNRLREEYEEPGIKFILESWRDGSLILCLNSSASAFRTVQAAHADGGLSSMLGMPVLDLTQLGVAATIAAPAYVYTRLCAYQTACIERELEPKLRFSLMRRSPIEPSVEPTGRGAASSSAAASTSQGGAASNSAAASSGAAENAAAAASAPQSSTVADRPGKARAATVGGDGADVPSSGKRRLLYAIRKHGKFLKSDEAQASGRMDSYLAALRSGATSLELTDHLSCEDLVPLAEALKANTSLTTLTLRGDLDPHGIVELAEALKANTSLTTLNLGGGLYFIGLVALAEALKANTSLTTLTLGGLCRGSDGLVALAESLKANRSLTTLNLGGRLWPGDFVELAEALKANTSLTTLNLGGLDSGVVVALAEALKANTSLTTLTLGAFHGSDGLVALAEALKANRSLTTLDLGGDLDPDGLVELAEALKANTSLTTVNLYGFHGSDGLVALAEALKANTSLTTLDLGGQLEPGGIVALAEALKANTSLTTLTLGGQLEPGGIVALAEALKANTSLTTLTLGDHLFCEDLVPLAEALKANTSLTTLTPGGGLDFDGIVALAEALKVNTSLKTLDFDGGLDFDGIVALAEALKANTSLTTLDISRCRLDDVKPLAEALKLNTSLATLNLPDYIDPVVQAEIGARLARNRAEAGQKAKAQQPTDKS